MNSSQSQSNLRHPARALFLIMLTLAFLAALAAVPYIWEFLQTSQKAAEIPFTAIAIGVVIERVILSALAIAIGLKLSSKVGLQAPIFKAWIMGNQREALLHLRTIWKPAIAIGLGVGFVVLLFSPVGYFLAPELTKDPAILAVASISPLKGLLLAFSAGVIEELYFRFGFMTLFTWLGSKLTRRTPPIPKVVWLANGLAALPFALLHLTNVTALGFPVTSGIVLYLILFNGAVGMVMGWLYWHQGLEAAMIGHFGVDIVLKVLLPWLAPTISAIGK